MFDRPDTGPARAGRRCLGAVVAGAVFGLLAPGQASAQAPGADAPGSAQRYQADRALCISGISHQEREDCLREAAAARQAARRGQLEGEDAQYRRNALRRCDPLPGQAREDCIARMRGEGTMTEGSVEEGGIYRERRELVPAPAPNPAPTSPPGRSPARGGAAG